MCALQVEFRDFGETCASSIRTRSCEMHSALGLAIFSGKPRGTWRLIDLSRFTAATRATLIGLRGDSVIRSVRFPRREPLLEASWASIALAGGGGLLMAGNLSMQRSLLLGVPLSIVLPLQGGLYVVLGTSVAMCCSRRAAIRPSSSRRRFLRPSRFAAAHLARARGRCRRRARAPARPATACARLLPAEKPASSHRRGASPDRGTRPRRRGGCCSAFHAGVQPRGERRARVGGGGRRGVGASRRMACLACASAWVVASLMRWPPPGRGARADRVPPQLEEACGRGRALLAARRAALRARHAASSSSSLAGLRRRTWCRRTRWSAPSGAWGSSESSAARRAGCGACSPPCTARSSPPWRCSR